MEEQVGIDNTFAKQKTGLLSVLLFTAKKNIPGCATMIIKLSERLTFAGSQKTAERPETWFKVRRMRDPKLQFVRDVKSWKSSISVHEVGLTQNHRTMALSTELLSWANLPLCSS